MLEQLLMEMIDLQGYQLTGVKIIDQGFFHQEADISHDQRRLQGMDAHLQSLIAAGAGRYQFFGAGGFRLFDPALSHLVLDVRIAGCKTYPGSAAS